MSLSPMHPDPGPSERFAEILASSLDDLLASLGSIGIRVPIPATRWSHRDAICATARFGNQTLACSLTLLGESRVFRNLRPNPPVLGQLNAADWACELVNQTVGRMRNRLVDLDLDLDTAIPELVPVNELERSFSLMPVHIPLALSIEDAFLEVWLQARFPPDFSLPEPNAIRSSRSLPEGAVMLF
jgi:hypothetical protein